MRELTVRRQAEPIALANRTRNTEPGKVHQSPWVALGILAYCTLTGRRAVCTRINSGIRRWRCAARILYELSHLVK